MKRSTGFTMIELLLAMAITAVVMAAVGGILVSTLEADQRVADALAIEKQGYGTLSLIRRDLEACYSYALGVPAFEGDRGGASADTIKFVTAVEGDPDQTGRRPKLQKIAYKVQQDQSGSQTVSLLRAADPYTKTADDPLGASTFALVASGLKSIKFSYLDPTDHQWKDDEWKQNDRVPLAVKISIEIVPPSSQQGASGFGLVPTTTFSSTVGIPTLFSPVFDQPQQGPPQTGQPPR
jgi:prepilin-type N-terminal cleavage/methylation domain-containing protein